MASINPYITFNGNCEEAFNFYKSVFGVEFQFVGRYENMPPEYNFPESEKQDHAHFITNKQFHNFIWC